jgi:hypothetical protein
MAGGHGWGGTSHAGSNHPRAVFRQRCPSLSKEGSFSRAPVAVNSSVM